MARKRRTSKRRTSTYQKCIGRELKGRKFGSIQAVRTAFRAAVKKCK